MALDFGLLSWSVGIAALVAALFILRRRGAGLAYLSCLSVFWLYLLLVLKVAIFPIPIGRGPSEETAREMLPFMLSSIQLKLLFFGHYATLKSILVSIAQNLALSLPFGFGLPFVARLRGKDILWLSVAFGLGIEVIQLIIALIGVSLGMWSPDHIVDANDALLNVAGVLLGYALFRAFASWYRSHRHQFKDGGVFAYIQDITREATWQG